MILKTSLKEKPDIIFLIDTHLKTNINTDSKIILGYFNSHHLAREPNHNSNNVKILQNIIINNNQHTLNGGTLRRIENLNQTVYT